MKHFHQIANSVDVLPLVTAIHRQPELWNVNSLRKDYELSPHRQADDIWLWFNKVQDDADAAFNDIQTVPYAAWDRLPQARAIIFDLMRRVEAVQLGRVIISRLKPGAVIEPHTDEGAPATFYTRFQVALKSGPGCLFVIDDEQVNFKDGEVWMINNRAKHSVINNSKQDRFALIIDLRLA